jgi:predicted RNA-binding Zn-ribbon protein involved in translation (DUF1610 family)
MSGSRIVEFKSEETAMHQVGNCSGCRHPLAVPAELLSSPIVCPKCGKVMLTAKHRHVQTLVAVALSLLLGSVLFLFGMGVASGMVEDKTAKRPKRTSRPKTTTVPFQFRNQLPSQDILK